jgi:hypothetical protein
MKYQKITNHPVNERNPFVDEALANIQKQVVRKMRVVRPSEGLAKQVQQVIVNSDGEMTGYGTFMQYIEVDEEQFAKIYLSNLSAFWELPKPAVRVFSYILTVLKPGQDRVLFRMDKVLAYTKYTHRVHVATGIGALINYGFIARSTYENEYFINPMVFFNGNRVTFAKTYIKKRKEEDSENQLNIFNLPSSDFQEISGDSQDGQ